MIRKLLVLLLLLLIFIGCSSSNEMEDRKFVANWAKQKFTSERMRKIYPALNKLLKDPEKLKDINKSIDFWFIGLPESENNRDFFSVEEIKCAKKSIEDIDGIGQCSKIINDKILSLLKEWIDINWEKYSRKQDRR